MASWTLLCLLWALVTSRVFSRHLEPTGPFRPPQLLGTDPRLRNVFQQLGQKIDLKAKSSDRSWITNITSFSVAVTSASETLWTKSYTAPILGNYTDSLPTPVTDQTYFRIASISKIFTVLAVLLQQEAGRWSLKDPITKHVPELKAAVNSSRIDWESITLESLASQLSGIPREYIQSDLLDTLTDPVDIGLPPVEDANVPHCGTNISGGAPCARKEVVDGILKRAPVFAPNYQATYSNMAFVLLGFALESLTGLSYADLVKQTIFDPLGMERATLEKPHDWEGVIPNLASDWDADIGTYGPTSGIYSTASDLALFARSILTHKLIDEPATNAWLKPHSASFNWEFAYGMPWEIFRTSDILPDSHRIQTIITKSGNLRGYMSKLLLIPEYDVALVLLIAGDGNALAWIMEEILQAVVPDLEEIARRQTGDRLTGTYASSDTRIDSSISVEVQGSSGLVVTSWISNSTDFLSKYADMATPRERSGEPSRVQLLPTETRRGRNGEVWRAQHVPRELPSTGIINVHLINDVDWFNYASHSVQEFVFHLDSQGRADAVELPAFRITLTKRQEHEDSRNQLGAGAHRAMKPLGFRDSQ
ncbi:MAG: hypothetical protein Q9194_002383 [Teloschistes cf. exilis]